MRGKEWTSGKGVRDDEGHGRRADCLPLHYTSGGPVWKSARHGTCDNSGYENGEFHPSTGLTTANSGHF